MNFARDPGGVMTGIGDPRATAWRLPCEYPCSHLVLLCQLRRDPLWHAHELTQQQLLGRFEAEPVADLAMHLRQRYATPIRPRGKKPAAVVPGRFALPVAATPARPGNCTPASHHRVPVEAPPESALILVLQRKKF